MLNEWVIAFRLILATVLSGMIGFEREFHGRAAGFRTHILLCVGSTLIMFTSMHLFDAYAGRVVVDPGRIAAGVVTGIGFLGAGTIIHSRASVRGLTTAASLWVVAGIGLAVGSGLYLASIETAFIALVTLMFFSRLEHTMIRKDWYKTIVIEADEGVEKIKRIRDIIGEYRAEITDFEVEHAKEGGMLLHFGLRLSSVKYDDRFIHDIGRLEGVKNVRWEVD